MSRHSFAVVAALLSVLCTTLVTLTAQSASSAPSSGSPVVSPDGRTIAFLSDREGNSDLYVVSADGGPERQVTRTPEHEGRGEWSTGGQALLHSVGRDAPVRLVRLEVATGAATELGAVNARGVAISHDGRRVAYMSGTWQASRLAVANVDGSNETLLTTLEQSGVAWNPRFSPDGTRIAFTGQDANRQLHVYVVGVDGSGFRQLTHFTPEQGRAQVPAWSADGRQIAFQLSRKGWSQIWRVGADGGEPTAILAQPQEGVLDEVPAWFPGGQRVAFQSTRSGRMEIWTVKTDGSNAQQVTGRR